MAPLGEDARDHGRASTDGGVAPRGRRCSAAQGRPQAPRSVGQPWLKPRDAAAQAVPPRCRTAWACAADAQQALTTLAPGVQAASWPAGPIAPRSRSSRRGRPGEDLAPVPVVSQRTGALRASRAAPEALMAPQRGVILATTDLDAHRGPPQALLAGDPGPPQVERGGRGLTEPRVWASSLELTNPERRRAWGMVMTGWWLGYAAGASRLRQARKAQEATFPAQQGPPGQHPTARGVCQDVVGSHRRRLRGEGAVVLTRHDQHQHLRRRLGRPDEAFYS